MSECIGKKKWKEMRPIKKHIVCGKSSFRVVANVILDFPKLMKENLMSDIILNEMWCKNGKNRNEHDEK